MMRQFLCVCGSVVLWIPCFAEEERVPTVPELIKKMYDYRMAIDDIRFDAVVRTPINTTTPPEVEIVDEFFFQTKSGRFRCNRGKKMSPTSEIVALEQHLYTPEFYFHRYPYGDREINDGVTLFLVTRMLPPFRTFDLRRIGTCPELLDGIPTSVFDYDALLDSLYPSHASDFRVERDEVDGIKMWKVSRVMSNPFTTITYWIDDQRGVNLVREFSETKEMECMSDYVVTLEKFTSPLHTDIWFPKKTVYWVRNPGYEVKEEVTISNVSIGADEGNVFALTDLDIPVGYKAIVDGVQAQYWDGKEFVGEITFPMEPVSTANRKVFWIVNAAIFALLAILILHRYINAVVGVPEHCKPLTFERR